MTVGVGGAGDGAAGVSLGECKVGLGTRDSTSASGSGTGSSCCFGSRMLAGVATLWSTELSRELDGAPCTIGSVCTADRIPSNTAIHRSASASLAALRTYERSDSSRLKYDPAVPA